MEGTEKQYEILKAMAHPVRLQILKLLMNGSLCAGKTNEQIPVSQPNLSQHLKKLREAGLIDKVSAGTKHCYYIAMPEVVETVLRITQYPDRITKPPQEVIAEVQS
jgi:ArsR family transcriptional regulator